MDALSLVLPAATIANPGANGADAGGGDARGEAVAADFATLLAAGMLPQQELPGLLPNPVAPASAGAETAEFEFGESSTAAEATSLAATTLLSHPGVMPHARATQDDAAPETWTAASNTLRPAAEVKLAADTAFAADAATIAAGGAGSSFAADHLPSDAAAVGEAAASAQPEPGALSMHPLHPGATEKAAASQPTALLEVRAPVSSPDFSQSLSQQVVWMADKDAQLAELRINPPELGPVEVRLQLSGDEATVQFTSAHAEVRGAIESAIARLRESMAQAGIQLGEASVSAESFRDQAQQQADAREGRGGYRGSREDAEPAWASRPITGAVRRGLVDLFA